MAPFDLYSLERHVTARTVALGLLAIRAYYLTKYRAGDVRRWVRGVR